MKPLHWFAIAGVLLVLGIGLMIMPTPGKPDFECAAPNEPYSGWKEGDCNLTDESYAEFVEWKSGRKWDNGLGLLLVLGGFGAAGAGVVSMRRQRKDTEAPAA